MLTKEKEEEEVEKNTARIYRKSVCNLFYFEGSDFSNLNVLIRYNFLGSPLYRLFHTYSQISFRLLKVSMSFIFFYTVVQCIFMRRIL